MENQCAAHARGRIGLATAALAELPSPATSCCHWGSGSRFGYGTVLNTRFTRRNIVASNKLKATRRAIAARSDRCVMFDSIASAKVTSGNAMSANVVARAARRSDGNRDNGASMARSRYKLNRGPDQGNSVATANYVRKRLTDARDSKSGRDNRINMHDRWDQFLWWRV